MCKTNAPRSAKPSSHITGKQELTINTYKKNPQNEGLFYLVRLSEYQSVRAVHSITCPVPFSKKVFGGTHNLTQGKPPVQLWDLKTQKEDRSRTLLFPALFTFKPMAHTVLGKEPCSRLKRIGKRKLIRGRRKTHTFHGGNPRTIQELPVGIRAASGISGVLFPAALTLYHAVRGPVIHTVEIRKTSQDVFWLSKP